MPAGAPRAVAPTAVGTLPGIRVLVVCTANVCRSPMAEVLLASRLAEHGVAAEVRSAGVRAIGGPASADGVAVVSALGLDLSAHVSRPVTAALVGGADLVLCMERAHVRAVATLVPEAFGRTFTLKELVRRAEAVGPCPAGEDLPGWLARVSQGRRPVDLLGSAPDDDVDDPIGRPRSAYERTVGELDDLVQRLVRLLARQEAA